MRKSIMFLYVVLLIFGFVGMSNASLIGDNVDIYHNSSGVDDVLVVTPGFEFTRTLSTFNFYTVNVEASSILIDFLLGSVQYGGNNILLVSDLDWSESGYVLDSVQITEKPADWDASRLTFGSDYVQFDLTDYFLSSAIPNIAVSLDFKAVPIPGAVWLLGSGLIGIAGVRRKLKK